MEPLVNNSIQAKEITISDEKDQLPSNLNLVSLLNFDPNTKQQQFLNR